MTEHVFLQNLIGWKICPCGTTLHLNLLAVPAKTNCIPHDEYSVLTCSGENIDWSSSMNLQALGHARTHATHVHTQSCILYPKFWHHWSQQTWLGSCQWWCSEHQDTNKVVPYQVFALPQYFYCTYCCYVLLHYNLTGIGEQHGLL